MIYNPTHHRSSNRRYVFEHIMVMEKKIGRPVLRGESIHHIDWNKSNNNPNNLHLFSNEKEHQDYHAMLRCFVRQLFC